jgi:hypothetical protein
MWEADTKKTTDKVEIDSQSTAHTAIRRRNKK